MSSCRDHGLGDCPQHATSGYGLLRRQYDEMVAENARLLAERDALKARVDQLEAALLEILREAAWESRLTEWRKHQVRAVGTQPTPHEACREIRQMARTALAPASEGQVDP